MPNPTPAQVDALATMFGITPETHRHLFHEVCQCGSDTFNVMVAGDYDVSYCDECGGRWDDVSINTFTGPDPLGPDADAVWLAPAMAWCCDLNSQHGYFSSVRFIPQMGGGWYCVVDSFLESSRNIDGMGDSMNAALLQACLAARVPEVCRAMGVEV